MSCYNDSVLMIYFTNLRLSICFSTSCVCLREYFEDVDRTWETFEKTLWGHVSNLYKLSKERFVHCFEY